MAEDLAERLAALASKAPAPKQRARAFAQGLTFGGADEAEAWLRSNLMGEDYDTALADVRGKLKAYQKENGVSSALYEIGGAALPAIVSGIGAVMTGGAASPAAAAATARTFPMLARLAGAGAAGGAAYGFGTGEGGAASRARNAGVGAVGGAVGAPVGYAATRGATRLMGGLMDRARRQFGARAATAVEAEVRRMADASGMTVDEIIDGVAAGRIMAENKTLRAAARGLYAQDSRAAGVLKPALERRAQELPRQAFGQVQDDLAGGSGNVVRQAMQGRAALQSAAGREYDAVYRANPNASDDLAKALADALARRPEAGREAAATFRAKTGRAPYFNVDDAGAVSFARQPTLREAETVRGALKDQGYALGQTGSGRLGAAVRGVEQDLRAVIDAEAPDLAAVRAKWANIEGAADAFDLGRKALSKGADDIAVEFEDLAAKGSDDAVAAYRQGVVAGIRRKAGTGSRATLLRNMTDPDRKERQILEVIYPADQLPEALRRLELASGAVDTANEVLRGSQTDISRGRRAEIGTAGLLSDVSEAANGSPFAVLRVAQTALKMASPGMTSDQLEQVARLMVAENPDILRRALTDQGAMKALVKVAQDYSQRAVRGGAAAGAIGGAGASAGLLGR